MRAAGFWQAQTVLAQHSPYVPLISAWHMSTNVTKVCDVWSVLTMMTAATA